MIGNVFGYSREEPRRLWFAVPYLCEIRLYRYGVDVYLGPPRRFVALGIGTAYGAYIQVIRST